MDVKGNTRISMTTERAQWKKSQESGTVGGRTLTEEVELDDLRLGRKPSWRMICLACAGQK